jgi:hypothetical protein
MARYNAAMFTFTLEDWRAWAPGIHAASEWQAWAHSPFCPVTEEGSMPRLEFLPAMQRRRLSAMARMVFNCAWPLADQRPAMPVVYVSRYGETSRDFDLLVALARDEPLSPASFGLSVHNAVAGQWSIIRHEMTESVAISVEADGVEHAFLEGCALLTQGHDEVLVIMTEERPPLPYRPWITDVPFSYAVAARIKTGAQWTVSMAPSDEPPAAVLLPGPLEWVRMLASEAGIWRHHVDGREWIWALKH